MFLADDVDGLDPKEYLKREYLLLFCSWGFEIRV